MFEAKMPKDWQDQKGWEKYYARLIRQGTLGNESRDTGSISFDRLPQFVDELKSNGFMNIWVAGCGVSMMPKLLAKGGLNVHATDISPSAIAFQKDNDNPSIETWIQNSTVLETDSGSLKAEVHNFNEPYLEDYFDFIINVKAIQGFDREAMLNIAKVHCVALKPSRQAIFDTMNVQGDKREMLEQSLLEAGFFIPFYELNVWYRATLRSTGIPHIFVLGQPMIPRTGKYADAEKMWETDMKILRTIASEFQQKQQVESEIVKAYYSERPETRTANVIYSTG